MSEKINKIVEKIKSLIPSISVILFVIIGICWCFYANEFNIKTVHIIYDRVFEEESFDYETRKLRVSDFFLEQDINYNDELDYLNVDYDSFLDDENTIVISKGLNISFNNNGIFYHGNILGLDTKEELLDLCKVKYTDNFIYPTPGNPIINFDGCKMDQMEIKYRKEAVETPFKIIRVDTKDVHIGNTEVSQEGQIGIEDRLYLDVYKDGKVVSSTLVYDNTTQEERDCIISVGYKFDWEIPEDLDYIDTMDIKAVSYNFDGRPYGVYGLNCTYGTVAVDRSIIPLGTKMFIEGYGYAIANDVGSGIIGNKMDMYMEEYDQCLTWGAQYVKVFILEYGDDTTYWSRYKLDTESIKVYDEYGILRRTENWPNFM